MASSHTVLLRTLHDATRHALHNPDEVAAVVEAAEQLSSSSRYRHLASPWDLSKLLASALRVQLNARLCAAATADSSLSPLSLSRLLVAAWRWCPLATLPLPSAANDDGAPRTSVASLLSITDEDVERVNREMASLEDAPFSKGAVQTTARDTAIAVVTSLLIYWHMLTSEAQEATADGEEMFRRVSMTVWRCLQCWTVVSHCAEARRTLLATWVNTVVRRALQCTGGLCAMSAVTLLESAAQSSLDMATFMTCVSRAPSNATLSEPWAKLHFRVCQHVTADIRARQAAFSAEWSRSVEPVLTSAFAQEPPLLSTTFTSVVRFTEPLNASLGELMRVIRCVRQCTLGSATALQPVEPASCVNVEALGPLLRLAPFSLRLSAAGVPLVSFKTTETFRTCIAPLIAVSLRWGFIAEACTLLDWFADALDERGTQWRRRLHRILSGVTLDSEGGGPLKRSHTRQGGLPYMEWLEEVQWTSSTALDVLATCRDVRQLRPVCDALLRRRPAEWAKEVLQDSFAPSFLLIGLTRLIDALLDARDAPLARFYLTLLGRLLPRCPCPPQLEVLLQLVHRLATVLTTTHLSATDYATPDSHNGAALTGWRRLKTALEQINPELADHCDVGNASITTWPRSSTAGLAWGARRRLQEFCVHGVLGRDVEGDDPTVSAPILSNCSAVALGTVVELCYISAGSQSEGGGQLWLRRTRANAALPAETQSTEGGQLTNFTARCLVGGLLRSCAAEMTDVMSRNRSQLMRGAESAAGETGRCLESQGPRELTSTTNCERQPACSSSAALTEEGYQRERHRKEAWWCERFELDGRIGRVAASMQDALGAAHILLLGHTGDSLSNQLQILAVRFAAECIRLRGASRCPPVDVMQHVTLQVLVAAPYLSKDVSSSRGQATCLYGPHNAYSCVCCTQTVRRVQRTLLETVTALGQLTVAAATPPASEPSLWCPLASEPAPVQECWLDLLLDPAIQTAVDEMVPALLNAYYREVAPDAAAATAASDNVECHGHHHADLLLVSREHVYLVSDGELHALPWEALDVCQDRSISRVPSLEYVKCCSTDAQTVSLWRTFVYRDDDARQNDPSRLTDVIAQHPHWEVAYGETLQAAAAAARDGGTTVTSPLLRRLLTYCKTGGHHIDTFVYAGHKGGEHLVSRGTLYDWIPSATGTPPTLVLLMGCSSARMQASGLYDSFGLPFAYLSAGVSCVLGCLWDVTDTDIDRLTCRFLQVAGQTRESGEQRTVGECLAVARRACKLHYLTSMATVFYGVNCYVMAAKEGDSGASV
ncbi:hypothetical protein JKF63_06027 [Porcisia hertigi]|uniref:separase n=1 Tax=Porcisia hertigi TaxID=2761500 RepID=A0A836LC62_9TRYP|nr:hypothetical protein JKF63_06027 [Porcisia hertigi]